MVPPRASPPPVCILAAGGGTRMGDDAAVINKALLPVGEQAALTRIIGSFAAGTEFVIALGYRGEQLRDFVALAHPDIAVTWVDVDPWRGPGSGPGRSLLCCAPHLERPFYLVAADTLWSEDLGAPGDRDWIGSAPLAHESLSVQYCNLEVGEGRAVRAIRDKEPVAGAEFEAFIGLAYVHRHARFWAALAEGAPAARIMNVQGELQISAGLQALIGGSPDAPGGALARRVASWVDIGTRDRYAGAHEAPLGKQGEYFYRAGERVLKFFADEAVVANRVERSRLSPEYFPRMLGRRGQFFGYLYEPGETLYDRCTPPLFEELLAMLEADFWQPREVSTDRMQALCRAFYHDKTRARIDAFARRHEGWRDSVEAGVVAELLARVPWSRLERGVPARIHGDLQFDNIVRSSPDGRFVLIDWRQDFASSLDAGDLYYDFAKLRAGIVLDYRRARREELAVEGAPEYLAALDRSAIRLGLDPARVRLLTALAYLNMAGLHRSPFDRLLLTLGRKKLSETLDAGFAQGGRPD